MTGDAGLVRPIVALRRLVAVAASHEQDRKWVSFIPLKRFGNDVAVCGLLLGTCHCNRRGHGFEYIVAKHEMVKKSCSCVAHDQASKRPSAEFMPKMKRGL